MKKFSLIIMLALYLISTTGIAVNIHYCAGKISGVAFSLEKQDKCACGSKKMKKNCCKSKSHFFKVKDSHKSADDFKIAIKKQSVESVLFQSVNRIVVNTDNRHINLNCHAPPGIEHKQPVYLLNCTFLI